MIKVKRSQCIDCLNLDCKKREDPKKCIVYECSRYIKPTNKQSQTILTLTD